MNTEILNWEILGFPKSYLIKILFKRNWMKSITYLPSKSMKILLLSKPTFGPLVVSSMNSCTFSPLFKGTIKCKLLLRFNKEKWTSVPKGTAKIWPIFLPGALPRMPRAGPPLKTSSPAQKFHTWYDTIESRKMKLFCQKNNKTCNYELKRPFKEKNSWMNACKNSPQN